MQNATLQDRMVPQKLIMENEMDEFFKVIGLTKRQYWDAMVFAHGGRTDRLYLRNNPVT